MSSLRERSCLRRQIPVGQTASTLGCLSSDRPMKRTRSCLSSAARTAALTVRSEQSLLPLPVWGAYPSDRCRLMVLGAFVLQVEIRGSSTASLTPGRRQISPNTFPSSTTSAVSPSTPTCQLSNSQYKHREQFEDITESWETVTNSSLYKFLWYW